MALAIVGARSDDDDGKFSSSCAEEARKKIFISNWVEIHDMIFDVVRAIDRSADVGR